MPTFELTSLEQTIHQPEKEIVVLLVRANYDEAICPGLEGRLAGIATFGENKEIVFGNRRPCVIAANHWKHHEL